MKTPSLQKVERGYKLILEGLGLSLKDPHFKDTPQRAARAMFYELCAGLTNSPPKITTFPMKKGARSEMVLSEKIPVRSFCAHHFLPFVGYATVAYIPHRELLGLSKLSRIVDHWARRPQVQEDLTTNIADDMVRLLFKVGSDWEPDFGVGVVITARHFCMEVRGVNHPSEVTTSALRGAFLEPEVRAEFLKLSR